MPKIDANRGDVAEAILGAAVCARFKVRPIDKITKKDIDAVLDSIFKSGAKEVNWNTPDYIKNVKSKVNDVVTFKLALPAKAMSFISIVENRVLVKDLYESAIAYVNGDDVLLKLAKEVSSNREKNKIEILSDGTTDQKGTKADIKTLIDGKETSRQISLKVDGGEQFAQMSGPAWETQLKLFTKSLGLNISQAKMAYEKEIAKYDGTAKFSDRGAESKKMVSYLKNAAGISYKQAAQALQTAINTKNFKTKLAAFIRYGATLNDENIQLVKLTRGSYKSQSFGEEFEDMLQKMKFSYRYSSSGDPKIIINGTLNGVPTPLIQIRAKFETPSTTQKGNKVYGTYMRNYIEAPTNSLLYKV